MNDENPYETPGTDLIPEITGTSDELKPPRAVSAGRGWTWWRDAFSLFARDWGLWLGVGIVFMVIQMVLAIIPLGSIVGNLLMPVFIAGMVWGARESDRSGGFQFNHLFIGFQRQTGPLIGLGASLFGITLVMFLVAGVFVLLVVGGVSLFQFSGNPEQMAEAMGPGVLIFILLVLALYVPVLMMFWFASTLVLLHETPIFEAMGISFRGCLANMGPFLIYGLAGMVLSFLGSIPFMLGWLVLLPVLFISIYTAYKDIYLHQTS